MLNAVYLATEKNFKDSLEHIKHYTLTVLPFSWARQALSIFGSPTTPLQEGSFSKASRLVLQVGERKRASNMCSHPFSQLNLLCKGVSDDPPFPFSSQQSLPSPGSTPLSKSQPWWGGDPQVPVSDLRVIPTLLWLPRGKQPSKIRTCLLSAAYHSWEKWSQLP